MGNKDDFIVAGSHFLFLLWFIYIYIFCLNFSNDYVESYKKEQK